MNDAIEQASGKVRLSKVGTALLATILLGGCLDTTFDASFTTAREARDAGYVDAGWIPDWLPDDATDIRETHDVDSNASMLAFSAPNPGRLALPDTCEPVGHQRIFPASFQRSWWPDEKTLRTSYRLFRCSAEHTTYRFVGVSEQRARVLHWRTYGD